jgi:hypothetical protein
VLSTFFSSPSFIPSTYSSLAHTIRRPEVKWRPTYHPRSIQTHNNNNSSVFTNQSQLVVSSPAKFVFFVFFVFTLSSFNITVLQCFFWFVCRNLSLPSNENEKEKEKEKESDSTSESEEDSDTTDDVNHRFQTWMNKESATSDTTESPQCVMKSLSPIPLICSIRDNEQMPIPDDSEPSRSHQQQSEEIVVHILTHNQETSSAMAMILGQAILTTRSLNTLNTSCTFSHVPQTQQPLLSSSSFPHTLMSQNLSPYLPQITCHNPLLLEILQQQVISCYDMIEEDKHLKNFCTENLSFSDLMNLMGNFILSTFYFFTPKPQSLFYSW